MHVNSFLNILEVGRQHDHAYSFPIDVTVHTYIFLVMHTSIPHSIYDFYVLKSERPLWVSLPALEFNAVT